jgi:hypothetical protein
MSRSRVGKGADGAGDAPSRDYEVGYGRPPMATRFRPGGIGNPKGRPKKQKPVGQSIEAALMTRVTIEVNGRPRIVTALEVIIRNLVSAAARGDTRAINTLFTLRDRYQDSAETTLDPAELAAEDRKIIDEYFAELSANHANTDSSASGSNSDQDDLENNADTENARGKSDNSGDAQ